MVRGPFPDFASSTPACCAPATHTQMHTSRHALGFPVIAFVQRAVIISSPIENLSLLTMSSLRTGGMSHSLWQPQHLMQGQASSRGLEHCCGKLGGGDKDEGNTWDEGEKTPHGVNLWVRLLSGWEVRPTSNNLEKQKLPSVYLCFL